MHGQAQHTINERLSCVRWNCNSPADSDKLRTESPIICKWKRLHSSRHVHCKMCFKPKPSDIAVRIQTALLPHPYLTSGLTLPTPVGFERCPPVRTGFLNQCKTLLAVFRFRQQSNISDTKRRNPKPSQLPLQFYH